MTSWLLPSSSVSVSANGRCGARLNTRAISVTRRGSRLPGRRENGTPAQRRGSPPRRPAGQGSGFDLAAAPPPRPAPGSPRAALLLPVAVRPLAGQPALLVLPADREGLQVLGDRDRPQHLELLRADLLGGELDGLLHRREGQQLQQVVLQHVACGAGLLVELR